MIVKDIKLKYCIGVLPINIVFAHNVEENTKSLNDALENKDTGKLVSDKDERKQPTVCSILCEGDSIKKNLTPEEKVPELVKNIIIESNIVQYKCNNSLIETKSNEVKVTDESLLKKIKDKVRDKCILTEIQIGDQYLYFFTKEVLTIRYFVKISEFKKYNEIISKNFKDILNNGNKFNVTVCNGKVIIKPKKGNIINGFIPDTGNDNNQTIDEEKCISPKEKESFENPFEQNPGGAKSMMEGNNLGEINDKNLNNGNTDKDDYGFDKASEYRNDGKNGYTSSSTDNINYETNNRESGNSLGNLVPETASYDRSNPYGSNNDSENVGGEYMVPLDDKNNSEMNNSLGETI